MIPAGAVKQIEALLGPRGYLHRPEDLTLYEYDGGVDKSRPDLVVFPRSTADVVRIIQISKEYKIPIVGRGAGTGLSGGSIPRAGGIVVGFSRMNRIVEIDLANERAVVEPGVVNLDITLAVQAGGYFYAPDPSSQKACTHRRQCRGKCRWTAYARLRRYHESCAGAGSCAAGWDSHRNGWHGAGSTGLRSDGAAYGLGRHHGAGHENHACG